MIENFVSVVAALLPLSFSRRTDAAEAMMDFGLNPDDEGESARVVDMVYREVRAAV